MTRARAALLGAMRIGYALLPIVIAILFAVAMILMTHGSAGASDGYTDADISAALTQAANRHGVSRMMLRRVSYCESEWNTYAIGDHGRSHGLFQLSDRDSGLLEHFHQVTGGASAYDPYASADYFARVLSGEFEYNGVTVSRWTCYRMIYG